jgi:hypothetical protein
MTNDFKKHHVVGDSMSSANLAAGLNRVPTGQPLQKSLTSAVLQTALSQSRPAQATTSAPQTAPQPTPKGK